MRLAGNPRLSEGADNFRRTRWEAAEKPPITPLAAGEGSHNPLRPKALRDITGQATAKSLMQRAIATARRRGEPLDHVLLVGPAGFGKTTLAMAIAHELDVACYEIGAPISYDTLMDLRDVMHDGDVLFIDEIHLQAIAERRGKESITQPEVLFGVMEDRRIATPTGVLTYPAITLIGATTDPGRLPEAFLSRFPLQPVLERYTRDELEEIIVRNARAVNLRVTHLAVRRFANASRGVPRQINNLVRNAVALTPPGALVDGDGAHDVLAANGLTRDGLTREMQRMLTFLFTRAARKTRDDEVRYQASVNTIATAIGLSRDTKAVALYVEPYLIERGFVQVGHGGRSLTDAGVNRAKELVA